MISEKFDARLDKAGECWLWTGSTNGQNTPLVYVGKRGLAAHRVAYEMANGPLLKTQDVVQTCGNRMCCRPDHLRVVSRRARFRGIAPPIKGKLTQEIVREIRASRLSYPMLATKYGVRETTIGRAKRGETWTAV